MSSILGKAAAGCLPHRHYALISSSNNPHKIRVLKVRRSEVHAVSAIDDVVGELQSLSSLRIRVDGVWGLGWLHWQVP